MSSDYHTFFFPFSQKSPNYNVYIELCTLSSFCFCCQTGYMSRITRKPDFCQCENKCADQLRSNCEADQRLCFRYTDSTIPLLLNTKFQAPSFLLLLYTPVCVGPRRKSRLLDFSCEGSHVSHIMRKSRCRASIHIIKKQPL